MILRRCPGCDKEKNTKHFRILERNPVVYSEKCLVCLHEEQLQDTTAQLKERKLQRLRDQRADAEVRKQERHEERLEKDRERSKGRSQNDAERELIRRVLARRRLIHFIQRFEPNYEAGWLHHDICERLERFLEQCRAGLSPRLMLFCPPRHGKSEIASKKFPAWAIGRYPDLNVIAASYAVSLPLFFSRHIRAVMRDPRYQAIFPDAKLDPENQNVEGWMTTKGGVYIPAGVGGGIAGKGADILIIDDPIKGAEDADSETIREKTWDWYGSEAYTRLSPRSGVLVIQTRWHDDDLSGRLIMQMKEGEKEIREIEESMLEALAEKNLSDEHKMIELEFIKKRIDSVSQEIDQWEIISYAAVNEEHDEWRNDDGTVTAEPKSETSSLLRKKGEALHPARFPYPRLMRIKRTLQPRHWSALYQQNPVPDEGLYFKKEMFRFWPGEYDWRQSNVIIAGDLAIGEKEENDYTVFVAGCLDYEERLHVLEVIRGKWDTFAIVTALLGMVKKYTDGDKVPKVGLEVGVIDKAIKPELNKQKQAQKLYFPMDDELKPIRDKSARARPLQGRMQQGLVYFPNNQPWVDMVTYELLRFPGGLHDDIVDAMAWLAIMAMKSSAPRKPSETRKKDTTFAERVRDYMRLQKQQERLGGLTSGSTFMGA